MGGWGRGWEREGTNEARKAGTAEIIIKKENRKKEIKRRTERDDKATDNTTEVCFLGGLFSRGRPAHLDQADAYGNEAAVLVS